MPETREQFKLNVCGNLVNDWLEGKKSPRQCLDEAYDAGRAAQATATPGQCPTCGSEYPHMRRRHTDPFCTDPWHASPSPRTEPVPDRIKAVFVGTHAESWTVGDGWAEANRLREALRHEISTIDYWLTKIDLLPEEISEQMEIRRTKLSEALAATKEPKV